MPTSNELLADHYLRAAGIAAVYADARGAIGAVDVVGMFSPRGRIVLCCMRGSAAALRLIFDCYCTSNFLF
jgi:hypothetical protein